jgi:hypothetical protein
MNVRTCGVVQWINKFSKMYFEEILLFAHEFKNNLNSSNSKGNERKIIICYVSDLSSNTTTD